MELDSTDIFFCKYGSEWLTVEVGSGRDGLVFRQFDTKTVCEVETLISVAREDAVSVRRVGRHHLLPPDMRDSRVWTLIAEEYDLTWQEGKAVKRSFGATAAQKVHT